MKGDIFQTFVTLTVAGLATIILVISNFIPTGFFTGEPEISATYYISDCGNLGNQGEYILQNDLNVVDKGDRCFVIDNNNIILNCDNHLILNQDNSMLYGVITSGYSNITIKNCNFVNFSHAARIEYTNGGSIINSTFNNNTLFGLVFIYSKNFNVIDSKALYNNDSNVIVTDYTNNTIFDNFESRGSKYNAGIQTANANNLTIKNSYIGENYGDNLNCWSDCDRLYVYNNTFGRGSYAINLNRVKNSLFYNNTINSNPTEYGIILNGNQTHFSNNISIYNNIINSTGNPIKLQYTNNTYIYSNVINKFNSSGIEIENKYNKNVYIYDNIIANSNYINTFGIQISGSSQNNNIFVYNNRIENITGTYGIGILFSNEIATNVNVYNNTIRNCFIGLGSLMNSESYNITNNTIENVYYGIVAGYSPVYSGKITVSNSKIKNASLYDASAESSSTIYLRDIFIDDSVSAINVSIFDSKILRVTSVPSTAGYFDPSKYFNATNSSANGWMFINISYTSGEIPLQYEPSIKIYKHDGSNWNPVAGSAVDTTKNYVYANITSFSTFAILAVNSSSITNVQVVPDLTTVGSNISISVNAYDNDGISSVKAYIQRPDENIITTLTLDYVSGNVYSKTFNTSELVNGTYYIDIVVNDTTGIQTEKDNGAFFSLIPEIISGFHFNDTVETIANQVTIIKTNTSTNTNISLGIVTTQNVSNATLTIIEYNKTTETIPVNYYTIGTGKKIEIEASQEIDESISWVIINISYTDEEVAGLDESSLRIYYYNETSMTFTQLPGGVDVNNNYVSGNSTHLSIFIPMGIASYTAPGISSIEPSASCIYALSLLMPAEVELYPGGTAVVAGKVKNTGNCPLIDVNINVSSANCAGFDYFVTPRIIARIPEGDEKIISLTVTAPAENVYKNCDLTIKSSSFGIKSERLFTIKIREITQIEVLNIIKDSEDFINWAKRNGLDTTEAENLLQRAKDAYKIGDYKSAQILAQQAKQSIELVELPSGEKEFPVTEVVLVGVIIALLIILLFRPKKKHEEVVKEIIEKTKPKKK